MKSKRLASPTSTKQATFSAVRKSPRLQGKDDSTRRSPRFQNESKGRRKLDFKNAGPLYGKKFYLDLHGYKKLAYIENTIKLLGGGIEEFLSKDIFCVLTNKKPPNQVDGKDGIKSNPSPFSGHSSVQQLSSHKGILNAGSPFSTDSPQSVELKKNEKISLGFRGKHFLRHAAYTQRGGTSDVLKNASTWGVKVKHIENFICWSKKQKVPDKNKENKKTLKMLETSRKKIHYSSEVRKLLSPYLKVEDLCRKFKPAYMEFTTLPALDINTAPDQSPFEIVSETAGIPKKRQRKVDAASEGNRGSRDSEKVSPNNQRRKKIGSCKIEKNTGYCECCCQHFTDFNKHIRGSQHQQFAINKTNYKLLDTIINQGTNFQSFLQATIVSVMKNSKSTEIAKPNTTPTEDNKTSIISIRRSPRTQPKSTIGITKQHSAISPIAQHSSTRISPRQLSKRVIVSPRASTPQSRKKKKKRNAHSTTKILQNSAECRNLHLPDSDQSKNAANSRTPEKKNAQNHGTPRSHRYNSRNTNEASSSPVGKSRRKRNVNKKHQHKDDSSNTETQTQLCNTENADNHNQNVIDVTSVIVDDSQSDLGPLVDQYVDIPTVQTEDMIHIPRKQEDEISGLLDQYLPSANNSICGSNDASHKCALDCLTKDACLREVESLKRTALSCILPLATRTITPIEAVTISEVDLKADDDTEMCFHGFDAEGGPVYCENASECPLNITLSQELLLNRDIHKEESKSLLISSLHDFDVSSDESDTDLSALVNDVQTKLRNDKNLSSSPARMFKSPQKAYRQSPLAKKPTCHLRLRSSPRFKGKSDEKKAEASLKQQHCQLSENLVKRCFSSSTKGETSVSKTLDQNHGLISSKAGSSHVKSLSYSLRNTSSTTKATHADYVPIKVDRCNTNRDTVTCKSPCRTHDILSTPTFCKFKVYEETPSRKSPRLKIDEISPSETSDSNQEATSPVVSADLNDNLRTPTRSSAPVRNRQNRSIQSVNSPAKDLRTSNDTGLGASLISSINCAPESIYSADLSQNKNIPFTPTGSTSDFENLDPNIFSSLADRTKSRKRRAAVLAGNTISIESPSKSRKISTNPSSPMQPLKLTSKTKRLKNVNNIQNQNMTCHRSISSNRNHDTIRYHNKKSHNTKKCDESLVFEFDDNFTPVSVEKPVAFRLRRNNSSSTKPNDEKLRRKCRSKL